MRVNFQVFLEFSSSCFTTMSQHLTHSKSDPLSVGVSNVWDTVFKYFLTLLKSTFSWKLLLMLKFVKIKNWMKRNKFIEHKS